MRRFYSYGPVDERKHFTVHRKELVRTCFDNLAGYVGHFHLYFWLQNAVGRRCVISPEFPTGNGRVDLHLKCGGKRGIIEVKSFSNFSELEDSKEQAARYSAELGMNSVTLAVFVPTDDENILNRLSGETVIDSVKVLVSAIGWV